MDDGNDGSGNWYKYAFVKVQQFCVCMCNCAYILSWHNIYKLAQLMDDVVENAVEKYALGSVCLFPLQVIHVSTACVWYVCDVVGKRLHESFKTRIRLDAGGLW